MTSVCELPDEVVEDSRVEGDELLLRMLASSLDDVT